VSILLALLVALAPAPTSNAPNDPALAAARRAKLRLDAHGGLAKVARPAPRKGKAAAIPGRIGAKAKGAKRRAPTKVGKPRAFDVAPCSTIDAPHGATAVRPGREGLVADKYWLWPNGSTIHVHFRDGSQEARAAVAKVAAEWTEFANIDFVFHTGDAAPPKVDISITFDDAACNSAMGPGSQWAVSQGNPSMRLCHIDRMMGSEFFRRAVLHEFGHALGMHHEHQSPKAAFSWNKPAVYAYYAQIGWDEAFVDQWVFTRVQEDQVRATAWDADSVMHYEFPASFTTDNTPVHGGSVLSALDKEFIAEIYPGRGAVKPKPKPTPDPKPKLRHYVQRRVALRNDTPHTLSMEVFVERRGRGGAWSWVPTSKPAVFTVQAGTERLLPPAMLGRAATVVARTPDGSKVWSDHARPVVLVDAAGYDDKAMQAVAITIAGEPDASQALDRDALWNLAQSELEAGRWSSANEAFETFVLRHPEDAWVSWAKLYIVMGLLELGRSTDAAYAVYDLIVEHADTDAGRYAWFYGGVAAMQRGACADAKDYFEVAADSGSGLPSDWSKIAKDYLKELAEQPDTWCR
jgi:hypothetical protein